MVFDSDRLAQISDSSIDNLYSFINFSNKIEKKDKLHIKSALMVPGDKVKLLNKIDFLNCDIAIINLEDGVSKDKKKRALLNSAIFISNLIKTNSIISVRINPLDEGGVDEINLLNKIKPHRIRVPKIKDVKDIEKALKLVDSDIDIEFSIETKEAFFNMRDFNIDSRIKAFYLGILDLLVSLKLPQSLLKISNKTIDNLLTTFLINCCSIDIYPISFVYQDYKNIDEFIKWCEYEKELGFGAKSCISPTQVDIVNKIFAKDKDILEKARYIKEVFEKNKKNKITGFVDDRYGFIDEPIYKDAINLLSQNG